MMPFATPIRYARDPLCPANAQAENYSTYDMMGGGTWTDMMERSELGNAQRAVDQARLLVTQARALQPALQVLPSLTMPHG